LSAKDLAAVEPEPFDCVLDGYAYIPRMLDKARATLAGTQGRFMFGCPVDHTCMARLGVSPELVLELAAAHDDDREVLAALRAHGIPSAEDAWFDAPRVEDEVQETYLRVRGVDQLDGGLFAGREHGARVSVEWLEADQDVHAHDTEEVIAVVDGAATFFLGEHQARIVRARQIVRIPAGVPHRCVAHESFRAVAARAE
jgi:mannose-6-phosphate isomerase-like protein (cupin superfamily)